MTSHLMKGRYKDRRLAARVVADQVCSILDIITDATSKDRSDLIIDVIRAHQLRQLGAMVKDKHNLQLQVFQAAQQDLLSYSKNGVMPKASAERFANEHTHLPFYVIIYFSSPFCHTFFFLSMFRFVHAHRWHSSRIMHHMVQGRRRITLFLNHHPQLLEH